jgi:Bax protein
MAPAELKSRVLLWLSAAALSLASAAPAVVVQMRAADGAPPAAGALAVAVAPTVEPEAMPDAIAPEDSVAAVPSPKSMDVAIPAKSAMSLYAHFAASGYTLETVRGAGRAVPRVFLARLPRDLPALESPELRKTIFIKMMLPLVLAENERIRADRARALAIRARLEDGLPVARDEMRWLADLAAHYGVDDGNLDELMRRADVISPSLALAQAALETGWGTSAVAQRGHAMFGQMVFRVEGDTAVGTVRMFDNLTAAIASYAHNLNTHRAYAEFRVRRAELRRDGRGIDGHDLALFLTRYSERKDDYVRDVRGLIRTNNLQPFDQARLSG